ncbi:hypothetical protein [Dactylosporangium darangshiense]
MSAAASFLNSDARAVAATQRSASFSTIATDARLLAFEVTDQQDRRLRENLTLIVDRFEAIKAGDLVAAQALKQRTRDSG